MKRICFCYVVIAYLSVTWSTYFTVAIVEEYDKNNEVAKTGGNEFLSLPLVPHHVVQKRRKRERRHNSRRLDIQYEQHRQHYRRRGQDNNITAVHVGSLYQGYGTHYVDLWCGSPPQRQTVIVDTGSSVTSFPCQGCDDCGELEYHIDDLFDYNLSSTFQKVSCNECMRGHCTVSPYGCLMSVSYLEGSSWTAFEAKDMCYITGPHGVPLELPNSSQDFTNGPGDDLDPLDASKLAFNLDFGCQTKLTGLFKTQLADGIMGMDNAREAFWKQMFNAHKMSQEMFALCFSRSPIVDREGTQAGAITLGGADPRLHKTTMVYTPDRTTTGFYALNIRRVYLRQGGGGQSARATDNTLQIIPVAVTEITFAAQRTIVDSGTTDTYFAKTIAEPLKKVWEQVTVGDHYSQDPISLSAEQLASYPTILIQLVGDIELNKNISGGDANSVVNLAGDLDDNNPYDVILAIPPEHYMEYDEDERKYVNRFYIDEDHDNVLGANAMMGHDLLFDVRNNLIGWAESDCDYVGLVAAAGYDTTIITSNGDYSLPSDDDENNQQEYIEDDVSEPQVDVSEAEVDVSEAEVDISEPEGDISDQIDNSGSTNDNDDEVDARNFFSVGIPASSDFLRIALYLIVMLFAIGLIYRYKISRAQASFERIVERSEVELPEVFHDEIDADEQSPHSGQGRTVVPMGREAIATSNGYNASNTMGNSS